MFKKITLFLALGLVLLGFNVNSQTTRFIVNPATSTLEIGDTLVVAVTSQDFTDVIAFTYSMNWDPNVLEFVAGDDQIVPVNIPPALFSGTNMANIGNLTFGWNDPFLNPMSVNDDLVLYEIVRFTAIGAGTSPINLSGMPAAANIVTTTSDETPLFTNASVTVTDPNAPNPNSFQCMFADFGLAIVGDSAATGEQLCLPVHLCNGDSLVSFQYSLDFDPAILQFDSITNINLPDPGSVFENSNNTDGWVFTFWTDTLNMGIDVPDTLIYDLCFTVIGAGGEMDTVSIVDTPGIIEVTKSSNPGVNIGMEVQNAPVVVSGNSNSAITVVAANVEGSPGDTVCVAVTAQNFDDVTSFQYTFNFDETILQYVEHRNFNANIPGLSAAINDTPMFSDTGAILVVYPNPGGMASTLMDGDTLYEVCFVIDPMASIGANALVGFSDDPIARGASQMAPATLLSNDGNVSVIPEEGSGDFELTIGTATFCPDSSICVPVTVEDGFTDVAGGSFRVNFVPADLTFTGLENLNPLLAANGITWLNNNPAGSDRIILIMDPADPTLGNNLGPGAVLFEICFTANSSADVTSPIILSPNNTPEFVKPDGFTVFDPIIINDGAAVIETAACPAGEVDITVTETIVNVLCNGDATGSISLDIGGGDGTFAISWTGSPTNVSGLTTPTISNLEAGSYTVSITSGTRDFTETYMVTEPTPLTGTTSSTNISCNGDADGTITLTPGGGVGPYTFAWSHGPTDQNLTNLAPGSYSVVITDANMCTFNVPAVTITQPEILAITIDATENVSCLNGNDGSISTTVTGGNGGNMYVWTSNTTQTNGDITNLTAGNYRVTVTDSEGCSAVSPNITITEPSTAVAVTTDNILPENCNGGGSIFITPSGGDNTYSYLWNTGAMTQDLEDVSAGGYTVVVTDGSGCSITSGIEIVPLTPDITISNIITQPNCDSEADGAINLTIGGGTGDGFTFNWDTNPAETTEDITNLMAGDYEVTVTDMGDGCTTTAMYQLTNLINLTISEVSSTPAGCAGATNGSLTIQVSGGSGNNYSYLWMPSGQTGATIMDVAAGTYTVTVTDNNSNCSEEESFTIDSDGGIVVTGTPSDASCNGAPNGSIDIDVSGAGNNPTFAWSDMMTTSEDISNIPDGNYIVTVTSTDGQCTQTAAFTVGAGNGFEIQEDGIAQATCDGAENGTVNITVNGASGPPTFIWSNGETSEDIDNAEGGTTVSVTVTDAVGCQEIASFSVPSGNGFDIDLVSIENASCGGAQDGAIDIELDGAVLPLDLLEWEGPNMFTATTEDISGVPSGTYTVFITDAEGCNTMASYTIDNDSGISGAVQNATDVTCNGSMDGSITLDILNASNNVVYAWSDPAVTGQSPIGLPAGTYSVTITDMDSGCTDIIEDIIIGEPEPITYTTVVEDASCNGANDGMITITAMGGNGGFSFDWSHDAALIGNVASGLAPGSYIVTITDSRGCEEVTEGIIVDEPTAISVTGNVTNVSGAGNDGAITAMATGGSGTYTNYDWEDGNGTTLMGQTITGLMPGTYDVTVTDDTGCTGTGTFTINAADAPNPTLVSVTDVTCFDGNNGTITIGVTGGTQPYTFNWTPPATGQNPTGLPAGTYSVTVTDDNGVSGILSSIVVGEPEELDYDLMDLISVSCPGFSDGEINISPIGGNGAPYTIAWNINPAPANDRNPTGLAAGNYIPTITDALGCTVEGDNIIVQEPDEISITAELTDPSCNNGGDSGSIVLEVEGGTVGGGYTYAWDVTPNPNNLTFPSTPQLNNMGPGSYFVTVTDSRGCTAADGPYTLEDPGAIFIQLDSVRHVRCSGIAEGAIFITTSGGSGALMPEWKNGQGTVINTGFDIVGLIGGNYTLCVTDAAGCSETLGPITVMEPQPITVDDIEIDNATASANDGEIRLIGVDGGTPAYTFNWEGPNNAMQTTTMPTISDIPPGEWRVTIVDANGCTEVITDIIILGSLNVQAILTDPTCNGANDGSIETIINAGTAPFECEWSTIDGDGIVQFACSQFTLTAGTYTVTVEDANGVVVINEYTLNDPIPMTVGIEVTNQTGSNCNGRVDTDVQGGTLPYTYLWNNGATTADLIDVCKGEYEVTVTDANGCIVIPPSAFVTGGPLSWANFTPGGGACQGGDGGFLNAEVSGGCGPYTFTLTGPSPSIMTNDGVVNFTGLDAGMYEITVTDVAGSTALVNSFEITETPLTAVVDTIINNTMGLCNGAVNITINGGQPPYVYSWSNGATSQDVSDVCINQSPLSVVVTDTTTGCFVELNDLILIAGLSVSLEVNNETCAGEEDGSIISTALGGTPGYTYQWSNGATTPNLTGLTPGSYTVTVTDSQGLTDVGSGTINGSTDPITVTSDVTTPTGANADGAIDLTVTGGAGGNDYQWLLNGMEISVAPDIAGLTAGIYTVNITDAFDCIYSETFNLAGEAIDLTFVEGSTGCPGQAGDLGTLEVTASGGAGGYTYLWDAGQPNTGNIIGGLAPGDYTVTVTDASGLSAVGTGTVNELEEITIELEVDEVNSNIVSTVSGGTAPYSYQWNDENFSSTRDLMGVPSGTYTLVISDANGCVNQATVELLAGPCEQVTRVMSPNNDSFNDEFIVSCANRFDIELEIYNRWGQLEFMAIDYGNNWVGTDQEGAKLPEGGYFYVIRYQDSEGQTQQIKGSFNIVY